MSNSKIITAGLIAGTLDILAASVQFIIKTGKSPVIILKYIASGVFGKDALNGGVAMAVCGLLFHYIIAMIFTILFFKLFPKIHPLLKNVVVIGILYGIFVGLVMQFIVVPLSNTPKHPFNLSGSIIAIVILIFSIGIPLSLLANRYYRDTKV